MGERSRGVGWALACLAGAGLWAACADAGAGSAPAQAGSIGGSSSGAGGPNRWAVLVGINRYTKNPRATLRGCENDVDNMLQILTRLYAFPPENIRVLRNEEATKVAIQEAIADMARKAGPDDLAVYYHSGHGSCVPGTGPDGWDECLLPTDFTWEPVYVIMNHEIGQWIAQIRAKSLAVILDTCCSGTMTRDIGLGLTIRFIPYPGRPAPVRASRAATWIARGRDPLRPHVLLAGCKANQTSAELVVPVSGGGECLVGAMTYFIGKALRGAADSDSDGAVSYGELMQYLAQIQEAVDKQRPRATDRESMEEHLDKTHQDAQLAGAELGETVFGLRPAVPAFAEVRQREGQSVTLDMGSVEGVVAGSIFSVHGPGSTQFPPSGRLGRVRIGRIESHLAVADAEEGLPEAVRPGCRAVTSEQAIRANPLVVRVDRFSGSDQMSGRLANFLRSRSYLRVSEGGGGPDYVLRGSVDPAGGQVRAGIELIRSSGNLESAFEAVGTEDAVLSQLSDELDRRLGTLYVLRQFANLSNPNPAFGVRVVVDRQGSPPTYRIGDRMKVGFRATVDCHVTVFGVGTSGAINILFPPPNDPDNRVPANTPLMIPPQGRGNLEVGGPAGMEVIKVIATRRPVNWAELARADRNVDAPRGVNQVQSLGLDLFRALGGRQTRADGSFTLPTDEWALASVGFRIVE